MRILMVLESVFPQDERVEKEIASLLSEGHEIRIATYTFEETPYQEMYDGYLIYRKRISSLMYKLGAAILVFPYYLNFWRVYLESIYNDWNFEALHIHDLPLARLGSEFKMNKGVYFIADQHEYYSNWIVQAAHYNTLQGKMIKALSRWEAYERKYLREADLVCTVEEPLKTIYIKERGIDPDRIVVVPNTPSKNIYGVKQKEISGNRFNLFYCGGLDLLRGLDTAIDSLTLLRGEIPEIRLILVGRKNKHFDPVQLAEELKVDDLLLIRNWVDYRELPYEIDQGHICFFTPPVNRKEIHNTIATKIYQYMARGKPVIVGSARYMKEFVEKYEFGLAIDEKSSHEFADAVLRIYRDSQLAEKLSINARETIKAFFWENTVNELIDFYNTRG